MQPNSFPEPPSTSRELWAIVGGIFAGLGVGALLLMALTLFLSYLTHEQILVVFLYGGSLVILPFFFVFLTASVAAGGYIAARRYRLGGNRIPTFAFAGHGGAVICTVLLAGFLVSLSATRAAQNRQRDNALRLRYGVLFYPNAVADAEYAGKMSTADSLSAVTAFYKAVPGCDATKSAGGGGTFILPCRVSGSATAFLHVHSCVINNEPRLLIDTTPTFEW